MKLKKAEVYKPTNAVLEEAIKAGLILVINHRTAGGKIITIRSVVPLVLGRYKGGLYLRGYHLAGTSVS
jgi:predicted DNA-binding transcriptional regulator YafY